MDEKLAGGLGDVQVVFKEFFDGGQGFFIEGVRCILMEYFLHEHFAQGLGKLIDQAADAQSVVGVYRGFRVENFTHLQSHFRFFVGFGQVADLTDHGSVGDADAGTVFVGIQHTGQHYGYFIQCVISVLFADGFYNNDIFLIYGSYNILGLGCEDASHSFQCHDVLFVAGLDQINYTHGFGLDVELFGLAVDIYQQ